MKGGEPVFDEEEDDAADGEGNEKGKEGDAAKKPAGVEAQEGDVEAQDPAAAAEDASTDAAANLQHKAANKILNSKGGKMVAKLGKKSQRSPCPSADGRACCSYIWRNILHNQVNIGSGCSHLTLHNPQISIHSCLAHHDPFRVFGCKNGLQQASDPWSLDQTPGSQEPSICRCDERKLEQFHVF